MSRAYRLIVVWMAGALGTAVVYGVRRLELAESAVTRIVAPVSDSSSSRPLPIDDDPRDAIVEYLKSRYDPYPYGPTYLGAPVVEVDDQRLRRWLPDTRFFRTALHGGGLAFWQIDLVVSFKRVAGNDVIQICRAVSFDGSVHGFLSQFLGISAPTVESRREVGLAVAGLLASPAYPGSARVAWRYFDAARVGLWSGRRHWCDVDVFSDRDGRVSRIAISDPIARRTEIVVSPFF